MSEHQPSQRDDTSVKGREAYNIVTDTMTGVNVRWRDNLFQAFAIFFSALLGVAVGIFVAGDALVGAIIGGILGMVAGLFGSGLFLMIFRAVRHAKGKHD